MRRSEGFTLIELMIVIAIIAIIAAIAIPNIIGATRAANERNASVSLKQIVSVEATFKSSDSDQNGQADYWIADVAAFYYLSPASSTRVTVFAKAANGTSGTTGQDQNPRVGLGGLQMIDLSMARADGDVAAGDTSTAGSDGNGTGYDTTHSSQPKAGYWFMALMDYETTTGTAAYATDDSSARNTDRFGFGAYPHNHGSSGNQVFIVNESGQVLRRDPGAQSNVWSGSKAPVIGNDDTDGTADTGHDTYPINPTSTGNTNVAGPWSTLD